MERVRIVLMQSVSIGVAACCTVALALAELILAPCPGHGRVLVSLILSAGRFVQLRPPLYDRLNLFAANYRFAPLKVSRRFALPCSWSIMRRKPATLGAKYSPEKSEPIGPIKKSQGPAKESHVEKSQAACRIERQRRAGTIHQQLVQPPVPFEKRSRRGRRRN